MQLSDLGLTIKHRSLMQRKTHHWPLQRGVNLLELMCVLAIISILLGLQLASAHDWLDQMRAESDLSRVHQFFQAVRLQAMNSNQALVICPALAPSAEHLQCSGAWHRDLIAFADHNANQRRDTAEPVVAQLSLGSQHSRLVSSNLSVLKLSPLGMNHYLGSLYFCYQRAAYRFVKKISASMQGRFKVYAVSHQFCPEA